MVASKPWFDVPKGVLAHTILRPPISGPQHPARTERVSNCTYTQSTASRRQKKCGSDKDPAIRSLHFCNWWPCTLQELARSLSSMSKPSQPPAPPPSLDILLSNSMFSTKISPFPRSGFTSPRIMEIVVDLPAAESSVKAEDMVQSTDAYLY